VNPQKLLLLILLTTSASLALADDFKTVNGKEYKNATVSHVESDGIVLRTKTGILKVYFVELPKDVQERFGYDPAKAARLKAAAQAAAAETATVQAQAGSNVHTVREVDSDQLSFIDQPFVLRGTIEISSYYNYGYYHAQETHDAFEVVDNTRSACHAYMDREKAGKLREQLLSAGGPLKGVFTVIILGGRFQRNSDLEVELLDYRLEQ